MKLFLVSSLLTYQATTAFFTPKCRDDPQGIVAKDPYKDCKYLEPKGTGAWSCDYFDEDFNGHALYIWQLCPKSCGMCGKKPRPPPPSDDTPSEDPWDGRTCADGVCYELGKWPTDNAEDAGGYCYGIHGLMTGFSSWPAKIDTSDMNCAAGSAAGDESPWIGMGRGPDGFYWVDGSKVDEFTAWAKDQPDNYGGMENCATLVDWGMGPQWNDESCDGPRLPLCARMEDAPPAEERCSDDMCYKRGPEPTSAMNAISVCSAMGPEWGPAIIRDGEQQAAAISASEGTVTWLGMMKEVTATGEMWWWLDETPVEGPDLPWLDGQPDNSEGGEFCAQLAHGGWNDIHCEVMNFPLCSRTKDTTPPPPPPTGSTCSGGVCYELGRRAVPAPEAEEYCDIFHGLVTGYMSRPSAIYSAEQQEAAGNAAGGMDAWLGMTRSGDGEFYWMDEAGSKVADGFTAWSPGEPNNMGGMENCGVMVDWGMGPVWNDEGCEGPKTPLCMRAENAPVAVEVCDDGMCYKRGPEPTSPMDAISVCTGMGGGWEASNIWTDAHQAAALAAAEGTAAWLGMSLVDHDADPTTPGVWAWLNGTMVGYTAWLEEQPDNAGGEEFCAQIAHGGWNDISCEVKNFPLCSRVDMPP